MHAVWLEARFWRETAINPLLISLKTEPEARVRVQAVRALSDLTDPVLLRHRLDAGAGDPVVAKEMAALAGRQEPSVLLEIVVALGRLRWAGAPGWMREKLTKIDGPLAHAAMQTLRKSGNWPEVLKLLDEDDSEPIRAIALRAVAEIADPVVVDGVIERLGSERDPRRRREYADTLARVCRVRGPWVYWGFRPAPRPANTETWAKTGAIEASLDKAVAGSDVETRTAILRRMQREKIPVRPETLAQSLRKERDPNLIAAVLASLEQWPAGTVVDLAEEVVREKSHALPHRLAALDLFVRGLAREKEDRLLELAGALEDSAVEAKALKQLGQSPWVESRGLLLRKLRSASADVRVAAIESLAELEAREAATEILKLLEETEPPVRRAAAAALGRLEVKEAAEPLLRLTADADPELRRRCLHALAQIREPRAVAPALAALKDPETELQALECLAEVGGTEHAQAIADVAAKSRSASVLETAIRALKKSPEHAARVQGTSGVLLRWNVLGPLPADAAKEKVEQLAAPGADPGQAEALIGKGLDSRVDVPAPKRTKDSIWVALCDFTVDEPAKVQFLASSGGALDVWLDGRSVYRRASAGQFAPDSDRFEADLQKGSHRLLIQVSGGVAPPFHVRFRRKTGTADQERLAQLALTGKGDPERGRKIFFAPDKPGCVKCHRIGDQGGRIGPDLSGAGRRFPKIYLIESILEPSRSIATTYQNWAVRTKDGRILNGVKLSETETTLTLGDVEGKAQPIPKSSIDELKALALSLMPEGLEKGMTDKEFVDLISFLLSQK